MPSRTLLACFSRCAQRGFASASLPSSSLPSSSLPTFSANGLARTSCERSSPRQSPAPSCRTRSRAAVPHPAARTATMSARPHPLHDVGRSVDRASASSAALSLSVSAQLAPKLSIVRRRRTTHGNEPPLAQQARSTRVVKRSHTREELGRARVGVAARDATRSGRRRLKAYIRPRPLPLLNGHVFRLEMIEQEGFALQRVSHL